MKTGETIERTDYTVTKEETEHVYRFHSPVFTIHGNGYRHDCPVAGNVELNGDWFYCPWCGRVIAVTQERTNNAPQNT